ADNILENLHIFGVVLALWLWSTGRKQQNAQGANKTVEGKQIDEHHGNIVMMLQGKLANTSMTFKDVLEVRTQVSEPATCKTRLYIPFRLQNMKESKDRTEQFMYSAAAAANTAPSSVFCPL
ncbi:hypothetical protein C0992_000690, partial [Termitomyces sp. T32_za158]